MATLPRTFGVRSLLLVLATLGVFASRALAESVPGSEAEPPLPEVGVSWSLMVFFAVFVIAVTWLRTKRVLSSLMTFRLLGVAVVLGSTLILTFSQIEESRMMPVMVMLGVALGVFAASAEKSPATKGTSLSGHGEPVASVTTDSKVASVASPGQRGGTE
jgi:uncharacterized membrane protein YgdD (TMEM256/DUF423 family)